MSQYKYATHSLSPRQVYRASLESWVPVIKLVFFPFLAAALCNVVLALLSHFVKTVTQLYVLKLLSTLIIFYFVLMAFYFVHLYWKGEEGVLPQHVKVYSLRFVPALLAFILIF